jgi:tartrate dehydrogenase/decarboxylase/D-malate dehydrogenase
MDRQHRIASIPADGIGPEVISAGLEVLDAVASRDGGFKLIVDHYDWGSNWYRSHGEFMPPDGLAWLRTADAIYFGAVGDPGIPDHITLWGLRLPICQGLDQYANVRPTRILPGITSPLRDTGPGDLDWVIVRENSESCASPSTSRAAARARSSPSSPSPMRSATAWCSGTRSRQWCRTTIRT